MIALPCFLVACLALAAAAVLEKDAPAMATATPLFLEIE